MSAWLRGALGFALGVVVAVPVAYLAVGALVVAELAFHQPQTVWEQCEGRYCVRHERVDRLLAEDTDVLVLVEPAHDALEGGRAEVPWPFPYEVGAGADVADDHVTLSGEDGTTVRIDTDILDAAATR